MRLPTRRTALSSLLAIATTTPLLASCTGSGDAAGSPAGAPDGGDAGQDAPEQLSLEALAAMDGRELVDMLDAMPVDERPQEVLASIQPFEVLLADAEGQEAAVDLPEDEFYVSIAPFADSTHECFFHSLTTCLGELRGDTFSVRMVDADSGEVLVDEERSSFDNGFIGFWLPRDIRVEATFSHDDLSAQTLLGTGEQDPTCVTTIELT